MQAFKRNILQHMLAVGYWMQTRQASGGMDPATATLELSRAGRTLRLTPQFVVEGAGGPITYVPRLQSGVSGFVGWLPYYNRQWPHATHKLAFKEHLQRAGLRTPAWGVGPAQPGVAYLVKAQQSTFGRGMRGPLPASHPVALAEGEYWEAFVPGALVKAWYWGGALQVAEVIDPPRVQGDGQQTVAQLASQLLGPAAVAHMSLDLLALQGLTPDSVPPAKGVVGLDYRYLSPLSPAMVADHNVRAKIVGTPRWRACSGRPGKWLWKVCPQTSAPPRPSPWMVCWTLRAACGGWRSIAIRNCTRLFTKACSTACCRGRAPDHGCALCHPQRCARHGGPGPAHACHHPL
jgi:hypothetical protein